MDNKKVNARSATSLVKTPGVFATKIFFSLHIFKLTLSNPTAKREMIFKFDSFS